jgi:hypothetical protein
MFVAPGQNRKHYDQRVLEALRRIWLILDFICGNQRQPAGVLPA